MDCRCSLVLILFLELTGFIWTNWFRSADAINNWGRIWYLIDLILVIVGQMPSTANTLKLKLNKTIFNSNKVAPF